MTGHPVRLLKVYKLKKKGGRKEVTAISEEMLPEAERRLNDNGGLPYACWAVSKEKGALSLRVQYRKPEQLPSFLVSTDRPVWIVSGEDKIMEKLPPFEAAGYGLNTDHILAEEVLKLFVQEEGYSPPEEKDRKEEGQFPAPAVKKGIEDKLCLVCKNFKPDWTAPLFIEGRKLPIAQGRCLVKEQTVREDEVCAENFAPLW